MTTVPRSADAVVVGGGTIGAWTAWFLRQSGLGDVVLLERDTLGQGASSRAAGMVRAQGGTEAAVRLGMFSRDFYTGQQEALGIDSGFVAQGYFMPCFTDTEVQQARGRIAMQQALGLDVRWVDGDEVDAMNPAMAPGQTLGSSYAPGDGYIDPPRNVLAYTAALFTAGVRVCERTPFTGLAVEAGHVVGVHTSAGDIATSRVVLTGGPTLAAVGAAAGVRIPSGGARHQVVVTEPHPAFAPDRLPMVFDLRSGIYWRPWEGGLMWGMSNPDEAPGEARAFDHGYFEVMAERMATLVPATTEVGLRKTWAATIDYTPDHLPILGPALRDGEVLDGAFVAAAGGHGMMWGPGVAKAASDLVLTGQSDVLDTTDLGLDRFDADGRSRLTPDPIALPFPELT
ncbi:NAD(P)/FAD-dependent oxidoreductase [Nocardioides cynanchi]|uniref:NAD(P)/FAD-dependent oxidoreductase n=1 Tax=Nocardioides cynanchi TaxID=2558918 RepID=UPI0012458625|nr:FAD-binding oxidoreductase [Nocardioides cynanchi]